MSAWMELDGYVVGTAPETERVLTADVPTGTEGPALVSSIGLTFPGHWSISGNLRDRDEGDVPAVRDWFVAAVESLGDSVTEAELELSGYQWTYLYRLADGRVQLVPRRHESEGQPCADVQL